MKSNKTLVIVFLLAVTFSILFSSCTKEKVKVNPPQTPTPFTSVARNSMNAQLIPVNSLSQARSDLAVASAGNKILFAGGLISPGVYSSRVDIFDITTNSWTAAELSQARTGVATAVLGKKIFFAAGEYGVGKYSGFVDIYDTEKNTWTTAHLDNVQAKMSGASAGNKVVFASGITAHIYDASTSTWTTARLSDRPGSWDHSVEGIAATTIGNTIYFAGGIGDWEIQKSIDIFNTSTNTWSKSSLSEYKGAAAGIALGNTNFWAGGHTWTGSVYGLSSQVEIRDMVSGAVNFGSLFQGNAFFSAVQKKDTVVFFTGLGPYAGPAKNKFDIYAIKTNTWSIGVLSENIEGAAIITVDNTIYVAGGKVNGVLSNQVRKLEF